MEEPPEPILEKVAQILSSVGYEWSGKPTALAELLGVDMEPNTLTPKLNVNAGRLYNEYSLRYENKRCHGGRKVNLTCEQCDGRGEVFLGSGNSVKNTVTIDTDRQAKVWAWCRVSF